MTTLLTVCTGNICRSPAGALLLEEYLGDIASSVSAGAHAMVDHGIPSEMLTELGADGIDGSRHRARQLDAHLMKSADLVLCMTRDHRTLAAQTDPASLRKVFTLMEVAETARRGAKLEGSTPAERLSDVPLAVAAFRPELAGADIPDVPDPYKRDLGAYHESYAMIRAAVRDIAAWVRG
ncbi:hypothetical protein [Demequina sp. NBRC 110052]|uniref:arsenate reductase/protein-tyrosine-phosphatase family protein n=1 Tax=Demequina sp. NBRC 110052 TaxID=1570341 RepID=UPI000A058950|nr:hypothetical protein [Demequina sp. NBRC 110052]